MMSPKPQAPLEACGVVTTIHTNDSTNPSRYAAGLAAKARMMKRGLNKISIAPVAPRELRSQNKQRVGAVSGPIPPPIGQTAANKIGAWPDSVAAKTLQQVLVQALESAAANARINAEALGQLPSLLPGLNPHPAPLRGRLASTSARQDQLADQRLDQHAAA
jgi:hypothetical protein